MVTYIIKETYGLDNEEKRKVKVTEKITEMIKNDMNKLLDDEKIKKEKSPLK